MTLRLVERIRHRSVTCSVLRSPLIGSCRALGQFPFEAEQMLEVVIAPLRRRCGPDDFEAAGNRVTCFARAKFVLPAEILLLDGGGFRLSADVRVRSGTVR